MRFFHWTLDLIFRRIHQRLLKFHSLNFWFKNWRMRWIFTMFDDIIDVYVIVLRGWDLVILTIVFRYSINVLQFTKSIMDSFFYFECCFIGLGERTITLVGARSRCQLLFSLRCTYQTVTFLAYYFFDEMLFLLIGHLFRKGKIDSLGLLAFHTALVHTYWRHFVSFNFESLDLTLEG